MKTIETDDTIHSHRAQSYSIDGNFVEADLNMFPLNFILSLSQHISSIVVDVFCFAMRYERHGRHGRIFCSRFEIMFCISAKLLRSFMAIGYKCVFTINLNTLFSTSRYTHIGCRWPLVVLSMNATYCEI